MIILGLDPGLARLGYGIVSIESWEERFVQCGVIETKKGNIGPRLVELRRDLNQIIAKYHPDRIVVETLFFSKNVKTAIAVAQARGVIMATCAESAALLIEVSPQDVKQAVTGYGAADKVQIQQMVKTLLGLETAPRPDDAADALAVALAGARLPVTHEGDTTEVV
jgi:crossover junction endodeoxyribonuclease RuvC